MMLSKLYCHRYISILLVVVYCSSYYITGTNSQSIVSVRLQTAADDTGSSTSTRGLTDLVELVPFDIHIGLLSSNDGIQIFEVSNIVTDWMNDAYRNQLVQYGYSTINNYAKFEALVLLKRPDRIRLLQNNDNVTNNNIMSPSSTLTDIYIAKFKGGAYFVRQDRNTLSVPEDEVLTIQQIIFQNTTNLLKQLQESSALGLGSDVGDVDAILTPNSDSTTTGGGTIPPPPSTPNNNPSSSSTNTKNNDNDTSTNQLEIVIIAAIAVAVLAFLFLLAAIYWAYRFDKKNRDAYLVDAAIAADKKNNNNKDKTQNSSDDTPKNSDSPPIKNIYQSRYTTYPVEIIGGSCIGNQVCDHSVISDSVVSDYRSRLGGADNYNTTTHYDNDIDDIADQYSEANNIPSKQLSSSATTPPTDDEEVSASLSQYYRSGMGKISANAGGIPPVSSGPTAGVGAGNSSNRNNMHNSRLLMSDAASVSSLESYGYSLDGTVPNSVMSPPGYGGGNKTTSTGSKNTLQNPYTKHLERIGGLPVEPDLRHLDQLSTSDIYNNNGNSANNSTTSTPAVGRNDPQEVSSNNNNQQSWSLAVSGIKHQQQQKSLLLPTSPYHHNNNNKIISPSSHHTNDELQDDLCTIDGSIKFLG